MKNTSQDSLRPKTFNASTLLNSKYLFGVVRVLLYSIIEFLCPQKNVI